jgi:uncharacterized membrane protein
MAIADLVSNALHTLFAGLWTGSVLFVTLAGMPKDGVDWLRYISRASALVLLLTGGHMAGTAYTAESLTGTAGGWAVLAMVVLWFTLAGLVEVAASRYESGGPEASTTLFRVAGVVAVLLLLDAGLLAGGI